MYCFRCNSIRSSEGAVSRNWGFGPRYFCKACSHRVKDMPLVSDVAPWLNAKTTPDTAIKSDRAKPQKVSMAVWVRQRAGLQLEELCRQLVEAFPDSKPGQNPKLAKSYVSCYLKER